MLSYVDLEGVRGPTTCSLNDVGGNVLGICMHQGQSKWILASYSWFYASISLILLFLFTSMSLHFPYIFLYFIFHYSRIYSRRGTSHLLPLWGYARAPTFRSELTTRRIFASARRDSFASAIPTRLHPLDAGLPNTFPRVVGGVETRAAYDLIGKSWPGLGICVAHRAILFPSPQCLTTTEEVSFGPLLV